MTSQKVNVTNPGNDVVGLSVAMEDYPLVRSLQIILEEIDEQYERERRNLIDLLPNSSAKDRALAMLETRYHQRRENYLRELTALAERS